MNWVLLLIVSQSINLSPAELVQYSAPYHSLDDCIAASDYKAIAERHKHDTPVTVQAICVPQQKFVSEGSVATLIVPEPKAKRK